MLNEKIKEMRIACGISQVELANKLGVSKQCVSNWENDNVMPSIEMLIRLTKFFSVSADFLLGLDNREFLEISGLTELQTTHIQNIINDIKK
ncbi:MAG: helix-turn-helix domain-containing protein [Clostridiales bacterium]|jgi:DNA-binding XRE family transcriptional regulator|nr:helix-turn-helix domain-containing protein [Clostridiales bacterium]